MWLRAASGVVWVALSALGCAPKDAATDGVTAEPSAPGPTTAAPPAPPSNPVGIPSSIGSGSSAMAPHTTPAAASTSQVSTASQPQSSDAFGASDVGTTEDHLPPAVHVSTEDFSDTPSAEPSWSPTRDVNTSGPGETSISASDDPNRDMTIWLAGDSTVANGNTPCPTGWGKHLGSLFNEHTTVRNSAAGGRSVRTWMYNVLSEMGPDGECLLARDELGNPTLQARWQDMLDNMKSGDALLIQFGINDGSSTCDRHVGIAAFKATYGELVAAAKERGVQAVLITPVSAIACSGAESQGTRGGFVDATIEAGDALGVQVLDLHARSVARYMELGFCPVPGGDVTASTGGSVGEYFCDDHTHFSGSGALDIAALVVELLVDEGVSFTSHLK